MNDSTAIAAAVDATHVLAAWVADHDDTATTDVARTWAKHTLLDWLNVTIAGARDPLVDMLAEDAPARADGPCVLIARGGAVGAIDAALINGAAGHALDFDDVSSRTVGHPTAPMAAAARRSSSAVRRAAASSSGASSITASAPSGFSRNQACATWASW